MAFPKSASAGKGAKVLLSVGDGNFEASAVMAKQASRRYRDIVYADRIYLWGAGKTLINMRPAIEPRVDIDGIKDGLECQPTGANDEVATTAGTLLVDNAEVAVPADSSVILSRPAATQGAWVAVHVHKVTGAVTATKGTDTSDGLGKTSLLATFGAGAGQKPLIPVTDLLIKLFQLINGAAPVLASEGFSGDRETADIDTQVLSNIGGVLLPAALKPCHVGAIARDVKITGYYMDDALSEVGTAKSWNVTPSANTISDSTFFRSISVSEVGGFAFTFEQLAADEKALKIVSEKNGYGAIRVVYPNGGYFQGICTLVPTFAVAPGALNSISVAGSFLDDPAQA